MSTPTGFRFAASKHIVAALVFALTIVSCDDWVVPTDLVGTWSSQEKVSVRYKMGFMSYRFESMTVPMSVTINARGMVTGKVGGAFLQDCAVSKNRGWIGRTLNLATDFVIKGTLSGSVFPKDTIAEKSVSIPFNVAGHTTSGSLFHVDGMDLYPMAGFDLTKNE